MLSTTSFPLVIDWASGDIDFPERPMSAAFASFFADVVRVNAYNLHFIRLGDQADLARSSALKALIATASGQEGEAMRSSASFGPFASACMLRACTHTGRRPALACRLSENPRQDWPGQVSGGVSAGYETLALAN
jgi:hypothetical protein